MGTTIFGITDRFKNLPEKDSIVMSQVNQNFHEQWKEFPDWLNCHMTPEVFITSKYINNRYIYNFKKTERCSIIVWKEKTFHNA